MYGFRHDLLESRTAVVTGGTSGIGRAIAEALAACGARVTVTGLTQLEVDSLQTDTNLDATPLDVRDDAAIQAFVKRFDELAILVNCAGTIRRDGQEFEIEQFREVVDVNLTGSMRMAVACRDLLRKAGDGAIVNTASMLSLFGSGQAPAYSASKGGVAQLTRSLAIAWASYGIRVNAIAPGWIDTPLTRPLTSDPDRSSQLVTRTPLGRWGTPQDVAPAAVFLCSPAAAFLTGTVIPVDGGYSAA